MRIGESLVAQAYRLLRIAKDPQHLRQKCLAGDLWILGKAEGKGPVLRGIIKDQRLLQVSTGSRKFAEI